MPDTAAAFHQAVLDDYQTLARLGYRATYFLRMAEELGAVQAARQLITQPHISDGFTRLTLMGRLDLSVEALVLKPAYRALFTAEERRLARQRLADLHYRAPWDDQ